MNHVPVYSVAEKMGVTAGAARRIAREAGCDVYLKRDPRKRNQHVLCISPEEEAMLLKMRRATQV